VRSIPPSSLERIDRTTFSVALIDDHIVDGDHTALLNLSNAVGKAVIVNFWNTWCIPCREEASALKQLREACGFFKVLGTFPIDVH